MKPHLYLTQRYRPGWEATSKEIELLVRSFGGSLHDLHLEGLSRFRFQKNFLSYHFAYYPFVFPFLYFSSRKKIIHLYTSFRDTPYLRLFPKENMLITSPNFHSREQLKKVLSSLKKARRLIVQSPLQEKELLALGIAPEKISLVYPPVDLEQFSYHKPEESTFTLLNASCPGKAKNLEKRGIFFLLENESVLRETGTLIKFLWRDGFADFLKCAEEMSLVTSLNSSVFTFEQKISFAMQDEYAKVHATLIPYLRLDPFLKLIPLSAVESLAAGKPVLVSSQTGIAEIIRTEKCGVVFEPSREGLRKGIEELKKNYLRYQKNCRKTAEKYFSPKEFLKKHQEIYNSLS